MAETSTMSRAEHPRERSLAGFSSPWIIGPVAMAPAILWTSLYPILPASRSGKIRTLACPATAEPGAFFDNAYAAAIALTNAIEKAGSTDSEAIAKVLKTQDVDTPFGSIHFDELGDATGVGFSVYQVKDGQYVQVQ